MKAIKFAALLEKVINEVNAANGDAQNVKIIPCDVVQICRNGSHKDVATGKFANA